MTLAIFNLLLACFLEPKIPCLMELTSLQAYSLQDWGEKKLQQIKTRNKTLNCSADIVGYDSDMLSLSLVVAQTSLLGSVESS